jgi:uracil-DNA glycosylase
VEPDIRKSLPDLRAEWETCTACALGVRRKVVEGAFVFGEGVTGGIMFIGEGPGVNEEKQGRPFVGRSGTLLREILARLNVTDCYLTNIVTCRSCEVQTRADGSPIIGRSYNGKPGLPLYKDKAPYKPEIEACKARLYEEIYLVDPVIIVALGGTAAGALRGGSISISKERGTAEEITIPGSAWVPDLTKAGAWARKVKGALTLPIVQNRVKYLMLPTLHPAYVLRTIDPTKPNDLSAQVEFKNFVDDIKQAVNIYNRQMLETHGVIPGELAADAAYDVLLDMTEAEEKAREHGVQS